jgi:hypothetical protein
MSEADEKHHVKTLSCKSESMAAWDLIKEWPYVCGPCFLSMESKFKSMKSINTQATNEVLLERALGFAEMVIKHYKNYYDMSHDDCENLGIFRFYILDKEEHMKNNSKKQSKKSKQAKDESESCFVLTAQFSCRTEAQCKELSKILQAAFEKQVDVWCGREPVQFRHDDTF